MPKNRREAALQKALLYLDEHQLLSTKEEEVEQFNIFYSIIAECLPELGLGPAAVAEMANCKVYDTDNHVFYAGARAFWKHT